MTELSLSIFDPNTLLPHRTGIAGLGLALSVFNPDSAPLKWEVTEDSVNLAWDCTDKEAISWLLGQTYQIKDGYLDVSALNLDLQGKYTFSEGIVTTFLQHSQQRGLSKTPVTKSFTIEEGKADINIIFRPLESCYYTKDFKEIFDSKGKLKAKIDLKGHHLPGLVEDFANGTYQESSQGFLSLLFLPIACNYYQLPNYRSALVIPEITDILRWIKQRQFYRGIIAQKFGSEYKKFKSSGAGDSALRFLLQEKLIENNEKLRVNFCEVYQLGKQQWDANQSYLKQAVYRIKVTDEVLELYQNAYYLFPNQVRKNDKGETWIATSKVLPWIADNLINQKVWYAGFYEFRKSNQIYERKGLVKMTEYLTQEEQIFFDAIQGAFSTYLREQIIQAQKQGRQLDYKQVTDKLIYRLQRPNTQPEFATVLVDVFSRYRSAKARGVGSEIYLWLHRNHNWKQARDLALLAIVTYTGKNQDGKAEIPAEIVEKLDTEPESAIWEGDD